MDICDYIQNDVFNELVTSPVIEKDTCENSQKDLRIQTKAQ